MSDHVFNLYPVTNQQELSISYRLVDVEGELGLGSDDPDLAVKNLNLLAKKLAFGMTVPVVEMSSFTQTAAPRGTAGVCDPIGDRAVLERHLIALGDPGPGELQGRGFVRRLQQLPAEDGEVEHDQDDRHPGEGLLRHVVLEREHGPQA